MLTPRRFPAPWSARELQQAFRVEDATGQAVAYVYFRKDENEARQASVLTHDEARRTSPTSPSCPSCYCARPKEIKGKRAGRPGSTRMMLWTAPTLRHRCAKECCVKAQPL